MVTTAQMKRLELPACLGWRLPPGAPSFGPSKAFDPCPPEQFGRMVSASLLSLTSPGGSSPKARARQHCDTPWLTQGIL